MSRIFISYRRSDSEMIAGRIYDRLVAAFGKDNVFKDVNKIPFGAPFRNFISESVSIQDIVLIVIGPDWLSVKDESGVRRLDNPEDFVRIETETALQQAKLVVPVLVNNAFPLKTSDLPESLAPLANLNAAKVRNDPDFHYDMDRLINDLKASLEDPNRLSPLKKQTHQDIKKVVTGPNRQSKITGLTVILAVIVLLTLVAAGLGLFNRNKKEQKSLGSSPTSTAVAIINTIQPTTEKIYTPTSEPTHTSVPTSTDTPLPAATLESGDISSVVIPPTQKPTQIPTVTEPITITTESTLSTEVPILATSTPIPPDTKNQNWTKVTRPLEEIGGNPKVAGLEMVYVPSGCFRIGSDNTNPDEAPRRLVCLSDFWMGKTEVTNAQYAVCVLDGICSAPVASNGEYSYFEDPVDADFPVVYISWENALRYAQWAGGTLPTEAQWEYAARGPEGLIYPWGDTFDGAKVNCCRASSADQVLMPVGSFPNGASWVGGLDMSGNVWEWTLDWYSPDFYSSLPYRSQDPFDLTLGDSRVWRGGSVYSDQDLVRSTYRTFETPTTYKSYLGFRIIMPTNSSIPTGTTGKAVKCDGTLESKVEVGGTEQVLPDITFNIRNAPKANSNVLEKLAGGDTFKVIDGSICADGFLWWKVQLNNYISGWAAEKNTERYFFEPFNP